MKKEPFLRKKTLAWRVVFGVIFVWGILFLISIWQTGLIIQNAKKAQFSQIKQHAELALPGLQITSAATLHLIPDLELWKMSVEAGHAASSQMSTAKNFAQLSLSGDPLASKQTGPLLAELSEINNKTAQLANVLPRTLLIKRVLSPQAKKYLEIAHEYLPDLKIVGNAILSGHHTYIVLLQNSDELRPTGGFMGSFAKIEITDGVISTFKIFDIYEPDGQFHGYIEAPHGVQEYLSSGHGLRLPDANWSPDFPNSAIDIEKFFNNSTEPHIDGVIAINVEVIQHVLDVLGPIQLPDFQQTITAENLPDLARSDRSTFFPGSQQKKQFLQALLNQMKFQAETLSPNQIKDIGMQLLTDIQSRNIQFYFEQSELENLADKYQISGGIHPFSEIDSSLFYLFPVEANVGINKVNRQITREIEVTGKESQPDQVSISFKNSDPQNDYINYQRILLSPATKISDIVVNGKSLALWDFNVMVAHDGTKYVEIGFLAPVEHQSATTVEVKIIPDREIQKIFIQKQSGVNNSPYHIQLGAFESRGELQNDLEIEL